MECRPRTMIVTASMLAACALYTAQSGALAADAAGGGNSGADGLAWFVQVSDLHLSHFAVQQMPAFGDKEGDFGYLASSVLKPIAPGALVLTGDLVDGKSAKLRGLQDEGEWKKYRQLIKNATAAGVPEDEILDLRGNHDVFDVARRGIPPDWFARYGAAGRRNGTRRVWTLPLPGREPQSAASACPAAVLLGVDLTPEPGLRGPTDFFGRADMALLREVDGTLRDLAAVHRRSNCAPVIVSAGHYPLSVVVHPDSATFDQPTGQQEAAIPGDGTLRGLLAAHGVASWLCGHLHGLFTQRQHYLHAGPSGGHLAELESTAWKDDRRFRLLVADRGALSFSDLYLNSPSKVKPRPPPAEPLGEGGGQRAARGPTSGGYSIVSIEPTQQVNSHIVVIASPPDARYAPLAPGSKERRRFDGVRALVFPVGDSSIEKVQLRWKCAGDELGDSHTWALEPMARVHEGQPLFAAPLGRQLRCEPADGTAPFVRIQVVVEASDGRTSTSEERTVARAKHRGVDQGRGGPPAQVLAEPAAPLPLGNAPFARFILWADMGRFGTRCTYLLWAVHLLGMLLLPKLAPPAAAHRPLTGGSGSSGGGGGGSAGGKGGSGHRQLTEAAASALRWLATPLVNLQDMATMGTPWLLQVIYAAYLARGPWFVARFLSEAPLGIYFPSGVLLQPPLAARAGDPIGFGGWRFTRTPDTLILCFYHWAFTLLPGTLWLAWVLASWRRRGCCSAPGARGSPAAAQASPRPLTLMQAMTGAPLLYAHAMNLRRLWRLYGPASVLLSPGFGWTAPLALALLAYAWVTGAATPPALAGGPGGEPRQGPAADGGTEPAAADVVANGVPGKAKHH